MTVEESGNVNNYVVKYTVSASLLEEVRSKTLLDFRIMIMNLSYFSQMSRPWESSPDFLPCLVVYSFAFLVSSVNNQPTPK